MNASAAKALVTGIACIALSGTAWGVTVSFPYIDINDGTVNASGGSLTMQGTTDAIIFASGSPVSLATTFTLNATYTQPDSQPSSYDFAGTLTVGISGSPFLTASFNDLVLQTGIPGDVLFSAPLTYTGGSLAGALSGGDLLGTFAVTGTPDFPESFTGDTLTAKVGAVVPLPPSLMLLVSGCGALAAALRRRPQAS